MSYRAGYAGKVTIGTGTTQLAVKSWKAKDATQALDTTSTTSAGFYEFIRGLQGLDVTLEATWDSTVNPYASTPALTPGTLVHVKLYANAGDTSPVYDVPTLFVESADVDAPVDGLVKYTIAGKSSGTYTAAGA